MHSGKEFISFVHVLFRHVRSHWICWNFFPTKLRSAISLSFFTRSFSYFASVKKISCVSFQICIHFCVWQSKVKVTFGWSVVLDKGTTCYKFWGHRLKVKVMRRQPRKISCTLFFLLYYNMYNEFLWNFSCPYVSCPPVCNLWLGFVTLTMNSIIMLRECFTNTSEISEFKLKFKKLSYPYFIK